jgi:sporulation protein YlmC with PRC-barrel domain
MFLCSDEGEKPTGLLLVQAAARRAAGQKRFEEKEMFKLTSASLLAVTIALPAMAQTPTSNHSTAALNAPATHDTSGSPTGDGYNKPSDRNSTMSDSGNLRASKIVGSSVYNDHDQKVGSVDDLVIGNDKTVNAVLSVGGFLGMGSKMVEVPFDKLQFGNEKSSSDNKIVMPGVTKDSLEGMPDYHYANRG